MTFSFIGAFFSFTLLWIFLAVFLGSVLRWAWRQGRGDDPSKIPLEL